MQSFRKSLTNKTSSLKNSLLPDENNSFKQSMSKPVTSVMERMSSAKDSLKSFTKSGTDVVGSVAQTTTGFFNMKNILFAIIIIFFLAFLGFNIFKYFASGTDVITNLLSPIIALFGMFFHLFKKSLGVTLWNSEGETYPWINVYFFIAYKNTCFILLFKGQNTQLCWIIIVFYLLVWTVL